MVRVSKETKKHNREVYNDIVSKIKEQKIALKNLKKGTPEFDSAVSNLLLLKSAKRETKYYKARIA